MKRVGELYPLFISDENILKAIHEVNKTHRMHKGRLNKTVKYIEANLDKKVKELRQIVEGGCFPNKPRQRRLYDHSAEKWRNIVEPPLWPDQYIHHMLIQVLQPIMMRGMDRYCCGSIKGRGSSYGIKALKKWIQQDKEHSVYAAELDIRRFYESIQPRFVVKRFENLIKDKRILHIIEIIISDGITIGSYCSQWFANTILQPLDHFIKEKLKIEHYLRYIDNITLLSSNKEKLHYAVKAIRNFLLILQMEIKSNWQVYKISNRPLAALGYRFSNNFILLRKRIVLRFKHRLKKILKKIRYGQKPTYRQAAGLLSYIGLFKRTTTRLVQSLVKGGLIKKLKAVIREESFKRLCFT